MLCYFFQLKMPVVKANKFSFNTLKGLNTALRNSMAMGQVRYDAWLIIQVPLIVCHKSLYCVSKTVEKIPEMPTTSWSN